MSKAKIRSPHQDWNPDNLIVQPVVSYYTDCAIPALKVKVFLCLTKRHAMKKYWGMEV